LSNDDGSASVILSFDFSFFEISYPAGTILWINNNGNLNFGTFPMSFYTSSAFPLISQTPMIAPFWADVDTSGTASSGNNVWYKMDGETLVVIWNAVGYFPDQTDKRNTFQVIISATTSSRLGNGNNMCFCYVDMDWTTGLASGGTNGFGGTPATVGANRGDGVNYVQLGRFDSPNGVDYLDGRVGSDKGAFCLDVSSATASSNPSANPTLSPSSIPSTSPGI